MIAPLDKIAPRPKSDKSVVSIKGLTNRGNRNIGQFIKLFFKRVKAFWHFSDQIM